MNLVAAVLVLGLLVCGVLLGILSLLLPSSDRAAFCLAAISPVVFAAALLFPSVGQRFEDVSRIVTALAVISAPMAFLYACNAESLLRSRLSRIALLLSAANVLLLFGAAILFVVLPWEHGG